MKERVGDLQNLQSQKMKDLDENALDSLLTRPEQETVHAIVKDLPEDTVSLQWRSALNEKLLALAPIEKKLSPVAFAFRALAGVAVGCALCVAFYTANRPRAASHEPQIDAHALASALISAHRQTVATSEIDGLGVSENDSDHSSDSSINSDADPDSDSL